MLCVAVSEDSGLSELTLRAAPTHRGSSPEPAALRFSLASLLRGGGFIKTALPSFHHLTPTFPNSFGENFEGLDGIVPVDAGIGDGLSTGEL